MSSIELVAFDPKHVELIGDYSAGDRAALYPSAGPCKTIIIGDIYACAMGLVMHSQRTAEAWVLMNEQARYKHAKTILKTVREQLDIYEISLSLHRTQLTIEFSKASFVRWSELLGFKMEGLMRAYDDFGNDYFLMARVNHGRSS